ncbi:RdgB/HAM1 family non-canonical purine NTP pyrophosphatase [Synechococcus elongatus]|uniref:dITP/XTP pyrophosphatase n=1 Tax=Synechococcus elongatus (strain ATCC 33912 / PCC 7942 / FACHB-805) TaxID=1140 RepID=Q31NS3_SYNE7|nr:RdgB/HAM1 family non-canonical purine NTP pyrophosphatase [Synechococcus elongatus]ABB57296.1 Ham1-like protein [Synechococcus elongatus PCC 7942 = FACHB-805]AJD58191.1 NTP phosphatase [Synechococcus elongatus UTEX 2973]MBD2587703.1 RdgB/HAM1 family non-canonical purine NTP pyrophosphatase [Synechococcus elongatus FACHB-242]MBD2688518.1 RdgB/HAM1 family non-canonical purine NTP pyrophosphatase [Synechococcus elongatus FACHB-1061]MBD2707589.1 RdgB/HAM1 family non-canonical purine NTP pyropho
MKPLVVATGNPGKLQELQAYLAESGWTLQLKPADLEIEETGQTFAENAALKAQQTAIATGEWAIADDSGLSVDALNGAPGLFSARWGHSDRDRIDRLLRELTGHEQRTAAFICAIAVASPQGNIVLAVEGHCPGEILTAPQGAGGFGYDPIFWVPELQLSFAELAPEQKRQVSHRGRALAQLLPQLRSLATQQTAQP